MQVILNADDFGRSSGTNAAAIKVHREGVLTSTSPMMAADATEEAIALARATRTLAVGLHLIVCGGRATLPPLRIPHLADSEGWFRGGPAQIGVLCFLSRTAQEELKQELTAQFERFAETGLLLSHVDGHMHMHVHPTVFSLLPLAQQYGARGLRLPRDDLRLALGYDRRQAALKTAWAVVFGLPCRWCVRRLGSQRLAVTQRVYGLMQTGRMEEGYVVRLLRGLDVPTAELYFHPSTAFEGEAQGPNPGDLATLLSPAVRQIVQERNLRLATYSDLQDL